MVFESCLAQTKLELEFHRDPFRLIMFDHLPTISFCQVQCDSSILHAIDLICLSHSLITAKRFAFCCLRTVALLT